jgi:hypothetical protein
LLFIGSSFVRFSPRLVEADQLAEEFFLMLIVRRAVPAIKGAQEECFSLSKGTAISETVGKAYFARDEVL